LAGVWPPQAAQVVRGLALDGVGEATGDEPEPPSRTPHILQKFMPVGLATPQAGQVTMPETCAGAAAGTAGATRSDGEATRVLGTSDSVAMRAPQSWQNSAPSRLTFPHWVQRGILRSNL